MDQFVFEIFQKYFVVRGSVCCNGYIPVEIYEQLQKSHPNVLQQFVKHASASNEGRVEVFLTKYAEKILNENIQK